MYLVNKNKHTTSVSVLIGYTKDKIPPTKFSFKLEQATSSFTIILNKILNEYDFRINENVPIRRIGIAFKDLKDKVVEQLSIFDTHEISEKDLRIEIAMNEIKNRFGKNSILRGISYTDKGTQIKRNKLLGGHNAE